MKCPHCEFIENTFNELSDNRNYWQMTEVFVYLHKSDSCNFCTECGDTGEYYQKNPDCISCGVCPEHSEKSVKVCTVPSNCEKCNVTRKKESK